MNVTDQEAAGCPARLSADAVAAMGRVPMVQPARYEGLHRPPASGRRARTIIAALVALALLTVAVVLAFDAAAYASTPRCNNYARISSVVQPAQADIYMPAADGGWGTWKCRMNAGDTNKGVAEMQRALNLCYGTAHGVNLGISLAVDGSFGPKTKAGLVKVQQYLKITADGVYGPQTAAASLHRAHSLTPYGWYWTCLKPAALGLS